MNDVLKQTMAEFLALKSELGTDRKQWMDALALYLAKSIQQRSFANVLSMCTHNSRRSQLSMAWVHAWAQYFGLDVRAYSAGVEVTACQMRTLDDLEAQGFAVNRAQGENPRHQVGLGVGKPVELWSKLAQDQENPRDHFAALIYCDNAAQVQGPLEGCALRLECLMKEVGEFGPELHRSPIEKRIAVELAYAMERCKQILEEK